MRLLHLLLCRFCGVYKGHVCACKSGGDGGGQGRTGQRGWISLGDALIFCRLAHTVLRGIFARASVFPRGRLRHNLFSFHRSALHSAKVRVNIKQTAIPSNKIIRTLKRKKRIYCPLIRSELLNISFGQARVSQYSREPPPKLSRNLKFAE